VSTATDGRTWRQYFSDLRARGAAEITIPPVVLSIERQERDAEPWMAGRSIVKTLKAVSGWSNSGLSASVVRVSDEFRLADSVKKPGQEAPEHRKGDLKRRAHRRVHWWLTAAHPELKLGFQAHWEQKRGRTARSAPAFTFVEAMCVDPFGMPTEFFTDFQLGVIRREKDEPAWAYDDRAARLQRAALDRDIRYNDGQSWLNRRPVFRAFREFEQWLNEANEMVAQATRRKEQEQND
jgi:hypothetical protein